MGGVGTVGSALTINLASDSFDLQTLLSQLGVVGVYETQYDHRVPIVLIHSSPGGTAVNTQNTTPLWRQSSLNGIGIRACHLELMKMNFRNNTDGTAVKEEKVVFIQLDSFEQWQQE
ncbi:unnamed protein product [Allacma fusca]|uniref:Uncharacterized protein n=1 Tax=Allacma fusca TaxID=39272 RepID=A0A8J2Q6G9_9HEXA|nr:unnamed protein product [Allacma fusca]